MIDRINELIGKPYDAKRFNCWHLVMELAPTAPNVDVVASKTTAIKYMNDDEYDGWEITESPKDFDICLLAIEENEYHHAGIYFNGLIIHADMPMVRAEKLDIIRNKYPLIKVYTRK